MREPKLSRYSRRGTTRFVIKSFGNLVVAPLIHERAVRLTERRLLEATPLSMAEIQADKDRLRAQFAMSVRRMEMNVAAMKTKTSDQLSEIGRQIAEINRLRVELSSKSAIILAMRAREHIRKSLMRRMVKLLLFLFVRSRRRNGRMVSALPAPPELAHR